MPTGPNVSSSGAASDLAQANEEPVAAFQYTPSSPEPGEAESLNATDSHDPDGDVVTYRWDLDDDGATDIERSDPNARVAFPSSGTYTVRLTVVDGDGATNTTTREIVIEGDEPPVAKLSVSPTELEVGQTVRIDPSSSFDPDGQITIWAGDNTH